jgi:hypothetical protein
MKIKQVLEYEKKDTDYLVQIPILSSVLDTEIEVWMIPTGEKRQVHCEFHQEVDRPIELLFLFALLFNLILYCVLS